MKYMPEIISKTWFVPSQSWILRFAQLWPHLADLCYISLVTVPLSVTSNQSQNTGIAQHWDFQLCFKGSDIPTAFFSLWISWQRSSTKWLLPTNLWGLNDDSPPLLAPPKAEAFPKWVIQAPTRAAQRRSHCALGSCWRREAELPSQKVFSFHPELAWVTNLAQTTLLCCIPPTARANTNSRAVSFTESSLEVNQDCPSHSGILRDMGALQDDTCKIHMHGHSQDGGIPGLITSELI